MHTLQKESIHYNQSMDNAYNSFRNDCDGDDLAIVANILERVQLKIDNAMESLRAESPVKAFEFIDKADDLLNEIHEPLSNISKKISGKTLQGHLPEPHELEQAREYFAQ